MACKHGYEVCEPCAYDRGRREAYRRGRRYALQGAADRLHAMTGEYADQPCRDALLKAARKLRDMADEPDAGEGEG